MPDKPIKRARERKGLRRIGKSKRAWRALYLAALRAEFEKDPLCRKCKKRRAIEGHHPEGQIGARILIFHPICRICHNWIHDHPNEARATGWLN